MALIDDTTTTEVTGENWKLLLEGPGIITLLTPNRNLLYRFDSDVPVKANDPATRKMIGDYRDKPSFVNEDETSKIFGIAENNEDIVEVLVTREVI